MIRFSILLGNIMLVHSSIHQSFHPYLQIVHLGIFASIWISFFFLLKTLCKCLSFCLSVCLSIQLSCPVKNKSWTLDAIKYGIENHWKILDVLQLWLEEEVNKCWYIKIVVSSKAFCQFINISDEYTWIP